MRYLRYLKEDPVLSSLTDQVIHIRMRGEHFERHQHRRLPSGIPGIEEYCAASPTFEPIGRGGEIPSYTLYRIIGMGKGNPPNELGIPHRQIRFMASGRRGRQRSSHVLPKAHLIPFGYAVEAE